MNCYKAARVAAGIPSQRQAAMRLEMDLAQYRKYEEGDHEPSPRILRQMVSAFGLTAGQILGLEPLPSVEPEPEAV